MSIRKQVLSLMSITKKKRETERKYKERKIENKKRKKKSPLSTLKNKREKQKTIKKEIYKERKIENKNIIYFKTILYFYILDILLK